MKSFNQADKQVFVGLAKLKYPEMRALLEFFKNLAEETDVALRRASDDNLYRLQGRAQFLEEFLTAVEQSAEVIERMR